MKRSPIPPAGPRTRVRRGSGRRTRLARKSLSPLGILAVSLATAGCPKQREMADKVEMSDTMPIVRAMHDPAARDSMLDTIPGGEMARGDSAAEVKTLKTKM